MYERKWIVAVEFIVVSMILFGLFNLGLPPTEQALVQSVYSDMHIHRACTADDAVHIRIRIHRQDLLGYLALHRSPQIVFC